MRIKILNKIKKSIKVIDVVFDLRDQFVVDCEWFKFEDIYRLSYFRQGIDSLTDSGMLTADC